MLKIFFFIIIGSAVSASGLTYKASYSALDCRGIPLDLLLHGIMNIEKGIFVEAGAFDGVQTSNTKMLEESFGWTGILVEPSENLFVSLCINRPHSQCYHCALGSFEENNTYAYGDFSGHTMSSFTNRREEGANTDYVLIKSLQSILDECQRTHINFFSLDTEGYELNILKGIDFEKTIFDYILIEIYNHQYNDIVSFLDQHGYVLMTCLSHYSKVFNPLWDGTHNDYLFIRKDLEMANRCSLIKNKIRSLRLMRGKW